LIYALKKSHQILTHSYMFLPGKATIKNCATFIYTLDYKKLCHFYLYFRPSLCSHEMYGLVSQTGFRLWNWGSVFWVV